MIISDLFRETFYALISNKARSGLTVLGIVIGIGSVIAMVSIGQGTQTSIEESIQSLGSNLVMVMPGAQRSAGSRVSQGWGSAQSLTLSDSDVIEEQIELAKSVAPNTSSRYQITAKGTNTNTSVMGVTPEYSTVRSVNVAEGLFISEQSVKSKTKVAVLGPTARDDLFGEGATNIIGKTIRINNISFTVVGITEEKGGSGMSSQDDIIYVPITTAQQYLTGGEYVNTINVEAVDQESMTALEEEITALLLERHGIADSTLADFSIMNQSDIVESASSIADTLTLLLGSIAGISLIVGGIGIMNMMLTTVTERTREIGLRKAIGAKRKDISLQFLSEAIMLTFIGGIFGIIFGWLASLAITKFGGTNTTVSMFSVVLAVSVSAAIGIIFGYYPARKASKLNPIEALRFE